MNHEVLRGGAEQTTQPPHALGGTASSELKHFAMYRDLVETIGIEPMTPCLQSRCSPS